MLFGDIIAVYSENHTEHLDTLCRQNEEFVFHRKTITSRQQTNRLVCLGITSLFIV
jgi:membrane-bound lytic murein transglycosylase